MAKNNVIPFKTDNKQLDELLGNFAKDQTDENLKKILAVLGNTAVLVPAVFPDGTDPEILEQIKKGTLKQLPPEVKPLPTFLKTPDELKYFGVYTDNGKLPKENVFPVIMNMHFLEACRMADNLKMDGIVINPYDQNVTFKKKALDAFAAQAKQARAAAEAKKNGGAVKLDMTPDQFHDVTRKNIELRLFPQFIFERGIEYIDDICEGGEDLLVEVYATPYQNASVACPYMSDDFSIMDLNISDDLRLVRIDLPAKNLLPGSCKRIYILTDPEGENIRYFTSIKDQGRPDFIGRVKTPGELIKIEEYESESGEMERVIELANESED